MQRAIECMALLGECRPTCGSDQTQGLDPCAPPADCAPVPTPPTPARNRSLRQPAHKFARHRCKWIELDVADVPCPPLTCARGSSLPYVAGEDGVRGGGPVSLAHGCCSLCTGASASKTCLELHIP